MAPKAAKKTSIDFLRYALAQRGDTYRAGVPPGPDDPNPEIFDCSSLVWWAAIQCGYAENWPGHGWWSSSLAQIQICEASGTTLTVEEAAKTAGALLFRRKTAEKSGHVAISLGNGSLMHAMSPKLGVNVSLNNISSHPYDLGGYLPDMSFPGPISGLPSGSKGTGPELTGGGFKGDLSGTPIPLAVKDPIEPDPETDPGKETMPRLSNPLVKEPDAPAIYLTDGQLVSYRWIPNPGALDEIKKALEGAGLTGEIAVTQDLASFGVLVGTPPPKPH